MSSNFFSLSRPLLLTQALLDHVPPHRLINNYANMPVDIPGFYYDESRKKYFKIERNGAQTHQYTETRIKNKRHEDNVKEKLKRLKLKEDQSLPFIQSTVLNVRRKLHIQNPTLVKRDCLKYRLPYLSKLNKEAASIPSLPYFNKMKVVGVKPEKEKSIVTEPEVMEYGDEEEEERPPRLESMIISADDIVMSFSESQKLDSSGELLGFTHSNVYIPELDPYILRSSQLITDHEHYGVVNTYAGSVYGTSKVVYVNLDTLKVEVDIANETLNQTMINRKQTMMVSIGNSKISVRDMNLCAVYYVPSKGDCLSMEYIEDSSSAVVLGYRDGVVRIWDIREDTVQSPYKYKTKVKNFRSVTNIKKISNHDYLLSSLGSTLSVFDSRMGFTTPKSQFNSIKDTQDVFGETIQLLDGANFMIQTSRSVECFNFHDPNPLKAITTSSEDPFDAAHFSAVRDDDFTLYTFKKDKYDWYD